jgi:hypothetical protein
MENIVLKFVELNSNEITNINGGGPILDGITWYYQTMGSFYHGLYDGIVGN